MEEIRGRLGIDRPCKPDNDPIHKRECDFKYNLTYTPQRAEELELFPFFTLPENPHDYNEFSDYLNELPVFLLKKGTILVHTTHRTTIERIGLSERMEPEVKLADKCWWRHYFPGSKDYGGGWFTHNTSYGGPEFGLYLYYKLLFDVPVFYIPNQTLINNIEKTEHIKESLINYTGSHIIQGPKNWKKKGYLNLHEKDSYFADGLGKRLSELGFNGYISCDECEVFLSHSVMKYALTYPFRIDYTGTGELPSGKDKKILDFIMNYCGSNTRELTVTPYRTRDESQRAIKFEVNSEITKIYLE